MSPPRLFVSEKVVLDTGPLLTYLVLQHLEQTNADKACRDAVIGDVRSSSGYRFAEIEQELFVRAVRHWKRLLTTSYVIAEVWKLREHSQLGRYADQFRRTILRELTAGNVVEAPCSVRELCAEEGFRELVSLYGPTDASVIHLAAKEECLLLTDERPMLRACSAGAKFQIQLLGEYLESLK